MSRRGRWFAASALALLGAPALVWGAGSYIAAPAGWPVAAAEPPARAVRFETKDGVAIAGSYWPGATADAPAVLLLHGINNDRSLFRRHAAWLNGLGYAALAIDFRGHGESAAAERSFGWREAMDAEAAVAFLRAEAPRRKVGVIGVSLGGAAALLGREGPLDVDAMVLQAVYPDLRTAIRNRLERVGGTFLAPLGEPLLSYQSWPRYGVPPERIAPIEGLKQFREPVLVIGGRSDRSTTVADSLSMHDAAAGPKALWLVEGADHVATSKLWNPEYRTRVQALFARALGEPGNRRAADRYGSDARLLTAS